METRTQPASDGTASTRTVWVGSSGDADAATAAREAAMDATVGESAVLLVVLASSGLDPEAVLSAVQDVSPQSPVIGSTTAGVIVTEELANASVVVLALMGDGFEVATGVGDASDGDLRTAAATAARCADEVGTRANTVLLLLSDGLWGDQQEVARGAYQQVGAGIPLVGGCGGDEAKVVPTRQFHGHAVHTNSVVAAAISSDGPIGIGLSHGWTAVGEPISVTAAEGVVVRELDGRAALDVYLERLGAPDGLWSDPQGFGDFASTRPLGLSRRGREEIRCVASADYGARTLTCYGEVPQGGLCRIMDGDARSILRATDEACSNALDELGAAEPRGVLAFDCVARKGVLGAGGVIEEVRRIGEQCGSAPVSGFYTYGEFARTEGATGFHNQTLVALAFG